MTFNVEVEGRPVTRAELVRHAGRGERLPFDIDVAEDMRDRALAERIQRWLLDRDVDAELVGVVAR